MARKTACSRPLSLICFIGVAYAHRLKRRGAQPHKFSSARNSRLLIERTVLPVVMSTMRPTQAKIIHHSEGLGAPDAETVRKRAQELAFIDGRHRFSEEDWRAAKAELHGGHES